MAVVCAILLLGFMLLQSPPSVALFRWVAEILALCAGAVLRLLGYDIIQTGIELRDRVTDHAIAVTDACDGSGLLVGVVATFAWLRGPRTKPFVLALAVMLAVLGILAFNLLRVILLFVSIGAPTLMTAQHLFIAPLLSAVLVAGLASFGRGLKLGQVVRAPLVWVCVAIVAAALWYWLGHGASCATVVPIANTLLWLLPGDLEGAIACGAADATLSTSAVISYDPVQVLNLPIYPADFTLAVPLVTASLVFSRTTASALRGALLSLGLFSVALTLAAVTASGDAAAGVGATTLMGTNFSAPFLPLGGAWLAVLKSAQNAVVYFNLFVLPLVLLPQAAEAATPTSASRGRR